jgi:hypothetical protein
LGESLSLISGTWFSVAFHMFIVIETTDHERRRRMTFRHVHDLAVEVLRNAKMAAAAIEAQRELGKGAEPEGPAQLCADEGGAFRDFTGSVKQRGGIAGSSNGRHMPPALRLVSSRCEPARNAARSVLPTRRAGSHLVLVAGDHARTAPR